MDIIDIMLAKAMTPQGKTDAYVAKANKAAQKAAQAEADAATAIATVEAAADEIATAKSEAADLLKDAQDALETAQAAQINTLDTEDVDAEVKKMTVNTNVVNGQTANTLQVITTYPDNTLNTQNITKLYKNTGNNEDGAMTQKAITDALADKASITIVNLKADKSYVDQQLAAIPTGTDSSTTVDTNLGSENENKIVIVGESGNIMAGVVTEEDIIQALILNGGYTARNAVGLEIDYDNKSFRRVQQASGKSIGNDFDQYLMYGGRKRCTVLDDGTISAFYGDTDYREDSANAQVMIYQPKFYYQRIPLQTEGNRLGKIINRDSIIISTTPQSGFKLHPLFINESGEEVDYVLLGAYESGIYSASSQGTYRYVYTNVDFNNDKLVSIVNTKPITGSSNMNMQKAEQLARNRGNGWHIYTIQAESANQMLEAIEFGTLNGQSILGKGVCNITTEGNYNQAALTGSTSSIGNGSGAAEETTIETNESHYTVTEDGKVAICYRGMENPWGNTWTMLGGIIVYGDGATYGGVPYICNDFNYSYNSLGNNYESVEFNLPNGNGWISAMGYGSKKYDWLLMPATIGGTANSSLPVGDNGWFDYNLTGLRAVLHGGGWSFEDSDGLFYYACDHTPDDTTYKSYGTRLMFIPTKNEIYTANIEKWQQKMNIGG